MWLSLPLALLLAAATPGLSLNLDCTTCLCEAATGCDTSLGCKNLDGTKRCGSFHMGKAYWLDAGAPTLYGEGRTEQGFETCANDDTCSANTTALYLHKFGVKDCTGDGVVTCEDNALINFLGRHSSCARSLVERTKQNGFMQRYYTCASKHRGVLPPAYASGSADHTPRPTQAPTPAGPEGLTQRCVACMCEGATLCNSNLGCEIRGDGRSYCGPFGMSKPYWIDAGAPTLRPGEGQSDQAFRDCANDLDCSFKATTQYVERFGNRDCNGDGRITCVDYTLINVMGGYTSCAAEQVRATLRGEIMTRYQRCATNLNFGGSK